MSIASITLWPRMGAYKCTSDCVLYIIRYIIARDVITIIYNDRKKCGKFRPKIRALDARIDIFEFTIRTIILLSYCIIPTPI